MPDYNDNLETILNESGFTSLSFPEIRGMYEFWGKWFAQPTEAKMVMLRSPGMGGYYPPFSETPGYTGNKDPKEYFHFRLNHANMDKNTEFMFRYCHMLAKIRLWQLGLDFNFGPENHVLRILHYLPTSDGAVGETHCDFDLLTVSIPGTERGLEVWDFCNDVMPHICSPEKCESGWHSQEYGVQKGEMLEIYTQGKFKATPHRVRTAPNTERFKAVFFYLPPNDFELAPNYTAKNYLNNVLSKAGTIDIGKK